MPNNWFNRGHQKYTSPPHLKKILGVLFICLYNFSNQGKTSTKIECVFHT